MSGIAAFAVRRMPPRPSSLVTRDGRVLSCLSGCWPSFDRSGELHGFADLAAAAGFADLATVPGSSSRSLCCPCPRTFRDVPGGRPRRRRVGRRDPPTAQPPDFSGPLGRGHAMTIFAPRLSLCSPARRLAGPPAVGAPVGLRRSDRRGAECGGRGRGCCWSAVFAGLGTTGLKLDRVLCLWLRGFLHLAPARDPPTAGWNGQRFSHLPIWTWQWRPATMLNWLHRSEKCSASSLTYDAWAWLALLFVTFVMSRLGSLDVGGAPGSLVGSCRRRPPRAAPDEERLPVISRPARVHRARSAYARAVNAEQMAEPTPAVDRRSRPGSGAALGRTAAAGAGGGRAQRCPTRDPAGLAGGAVPGPGTSGRPDTGASDDRVDGRRAGDKLGSKRVRDLLVDGAGPSLPVVTTTTPSSRWRRSWPAALSVGGGDGDGELIGVITASRLLELALPRR